MKRFFANSRTLAKLTRARLIARHSRERGNPGLHRDTVAPLLWEGLQSRRCCSSADRTASGLKPLPQETAEAIEG